MMIWQRRNIWLVWIPIAWLGFGLRIFQLDKFAFRGDESFTVQYWMIAPLTETITQYLTLDPQPLLAYAFYQFWGQLLGTGEFTTRMLPALFGFVGIAAIYALTHRLTHSRLMSWFVSLIWATHPFMIYHSQDARNYALWSTVSIVAVWAGVKALNRRNSWVDWIAFVSFTILASYLYYLDFFIVAAFSFYVLIFYWRDWHTYFKWLCAMLIVILFVSPWYLQPQLRSGGGYGGTTTGFDLNKLLFDFPSTLLFGHTLSMNVFGILLWVAIFVGIFIMLRQIRSVGLLTLFVVVIPIVLLSFVSTRLNVFAPRYILATLPFWVIALSNLIRYLWSQKGFTRYLAVAFTVVWFALTSFSLYVYFTDYTKSPDWIALTNYLATHTQETDLVIQASADPSFGYYYHFVSGATASERALPAQPDQPPSEIRAELLMASQHYDSIWLAAQGFTDWPNYGVVESWLDNNMQRVIDTNANGLRIQQYRHWDDVPSASEPHIVKFGEIVNVIEILVHEPQPTGELVIWVYWQPLKTTPTPLTAFIHLTGNINPTTGTPLWRQDDHEPQHQRIRTTNWQPNTVYRDIFTLPDVTSLPSGTYNLLLGLYDPQTGNRIPTDNNQDAHAITDWQKNKGASKHP